MSASDGGEFSVEVIVYGPLRGATGEKSVEIAVTDATDESGTMTVADVLSAFVDAYPRARSQLFDDEGVSPGVRMSIDDERVTPETAVRPGVTLRLHPAVHGGRGVSRRR